MTISRRIRPAPLLALAVAAACSTFTISVDKNPAADFGRYRTFGWLPASAAPPADRDVGDRFTDARLTVFIEAAMQRQGYAPASNDAPDLFVTYRLVRTDGYDEPQLPYAAQWRRGSYRSALHASGDSYERGTLIVDVIDRAANDLVWRGTASARLLPHVSFKERVTRAEKAVNAIFERFPTR